jgi:hypothetical protein
MQRTCTSTASTASLSLSTYPDPGPDSDQRAPSEIDKPDSVNIEDLGLIQTEDSSSVASRNVRIFHDADGIYVCACADLDRRQGLVQCRGVVPYSTSELPKKDRR